MEFAAVELDSNVIADGDQPLHSGPYSDQPIQVQFIVWDLIASKT